MRERKERATREERVATRCRRRLFLTSNDRDANRKTREHERREPTKRWHLNQGKERYIIATGISSFSIMACTRSSVHSQACKSRKVRGQIGIVTRSQCPRLKKSLVPSFVRYRAYRIFKKRLDLSVTRDIIFRFIKEIDRAASGFLNHTDLSNFSRGSLSFEFSTSSFSLVTQTITMVNVCF